MADCLLTLNWFNLEQSAVKCHRVKRQLPDIWMKSTIVCFLLHYNAIIIVQSCSLFDFILSVICFRSKCSRAAPTTAVYIVSDVADKHFDVKLVWKQNDRKDGWKVTNQHFKGSIIRSLLCLKCLNKFAYCKIEWPKSEGNFKMKAGAVSI